MKKARIRALIHIKTGIPSGCLRGRNEKSPYKGIDTLSKYSDSFKALCRNEKSPYKGIDTPPCLECFLKRQIVEMKKARIRALIQSYQGLAYAVHHL